VKQKLTLEICKKKAASHGGTCLANDYINNRQRMGWRCSEGHEWTTTVKAVVNQGAWCPFCAGNALLTIVDAQADAIANGGRCLSKEYVNSTEPLDWECDQGHHWPASLDAVRNKGTWCPTCAGNIRVTIEEVRELAISKGGVCLAEGIENSLTPVEWRCDQGHQWFAAPAHVKPSGYRNGNWCPICAQARRNTLHPEYR